MMNTRQYNPYRYILISLTVISLNVGYLPAFDCEYIIEACVDDMAEPVGKAKIRDYPDSYQSPTNRNHTFRGIFFEISSEFHASDSYTYEDIGAKTPIDLRKEHLVSSIFNFYETEKNGLRCQIYVTESYFNHMMQEVFDWTSVNSFCCFKKAKPRHKTINNTRHLFWVRPIIDPESDAGKISSLFEVDLNQPNFQGDGEVTFNAYQRHEIPWTLNQPPQSSYQHHWHQHPWLVITPFIHTLWPVPADTTHSSQPISFSHQQMCILPVAGILEEKQISILEVKVKTVSFHTYVMDEGEYKYESEIGITVQHYHINPNRGPYTLDIWALGEEQFAPLGWRYKEKKHPSRAIQYIMVRNQVWPEMKLSREVRRFMGGMVQMEQTSF
ncbi:hypothetical protein ACWJJH_00350 [Endozoicomonadaceae bacterium StTr2]